MFWISSEPSARGEEFHYDLGAVRPFETRASPIRLCRKRSFGTDRDPHSVGGLTPPASYHSCTTSSEEPPLSNFNSQCDIPVIEDSSANFRS